MTFVIPLSKAEGPFSRQVYLWFRCAILLGTLQAGARLPSTRDLAEQLHLSQTVVLLGYDQLLAEGFVQSQKGSGTYVSHGLRSSQAKVAKPSAQLSLSDFGFSAVATTSKIDFPGQRLTPLRYDFAYARSNVESFPFEAWLRLLMRRGRKAPLREFEYGPAAGSPALREAISAHLRRSRAVVCDAEQVIIVNGSQQALDLAVRVLLNRGDRVVIEEPQYQGAREIFCAAGARLCAVPVDGEGLDPARLPPKARIAHLTPSHQFPTGAILPLARRLALLEWAKRADAAVIEDDYDGEFRYEGQAVESLQGLDTDGRVIYTGTFSRTIFPALRIGYLVAPKALVPALTSAKWLCDRHTPILEQETLAGFISTGAYERHLRRTRRRIARQRTALLESVQRHLGNRVTVTGAGSGTHIVLWPRRRVSERNIIAEAAVRNVGVYGISAYFSRRPPGAGFLLGYSRLNEQEIREAIRRLSETKL